MSKPEFIETIVREVMRRLSTDAGVTSSSLTSTPMDSSNSAFDALRLEDRVITLATLEGRLTGIRSLLVPTGTVVTPAAKDLLKQHSVELRKTDWPSDQAARRILIAAQRPCELTAAQRERCQEAKLDCNVAVISDLEALVSRIAGGVPRPYRAALVICDRPHQFACLANRHRSLRAALGLDAAMARISMQQVSANVLVTSGTVICDRILDELIPATARACSAER